VFVDFHCHLEHELLAGGLDGVLKRAVDAGVAKVVSAGSGPEANAAQVSIRKRFPGTVEIVLGVSPYDVPKCDLQEQLSFIRASRDSIVGIGEIGLDAHHFSADELPAQEGAFRSQLALAEELGLPVVVHSRKAEGRVLEILREFPAVSAMMHFFLVEKLALPAVSQGCMVSLPTIKSDSRLKIAVKLPLSSLACETDSPFGLGPGITSEPKDVVAAYGVVAQARKVSVDDAASGICANAAKFFGWE